MSTRTRFAFALVALVLLASPAALHSEEAPAMSVVAVEIPTTRGVKLVGALHKPAEPSDTIVVIGSGRGYHKDLPLLTKTAEALQAVGLMALRFDWAYFTAKGKHHPELETEMADLDAAMTFARKQPGIKRLFLAGKSLGSVAAAMRAAKDPDSIDGLMLLTFPIHPPADTERVFDDSKTIQSWNKPWLILTGDADPYCKLGPFYRYAGACANAPRLVIVPGDHSLRGPDKVEADTLANCELAAHGITRWARIWADAKSR